MIFFIGEIVDAKEIKKIIKLCKDQGVLTFKSNELEFTLSPGALKRSIIIQDDKIETEKPMSPEDILLWSAGGIDA